MIASASVIEKSSRGNLEACFKHLDQKTPIEVTLNDEVLTKIDFFLSQRRGDIELALQRAEVYFPLIEEMLDKYDLPLELKYLAVIESGLNPLARSSSGAVGIWQFLYNTCSLFDLQVDSYIDERKDPYKATEAACKYLSYLYLTYHDWNLVMASYNGGPGEVRKAIERSGGKTNYWEIRPYLSAQAKAYVPAFIAMMYLMTYPENHGLHKRPADLGYRMTDTLRISYAVSFQQISSVIGLPVSQLAEMNPMYSKLYIPRREQACILILPRELIPVYLRNEKKILTTSVPRTDYNTLLSEAGSTLNRNRVVHVVQRGEFCHKIAINYNCTIENIKAWNNLNSTTLYPGQTLNIWVHQ